MGFNSGFKELKHIGSFTKRTNLFWISNFRRVLNVSSFFLGNSPASEFLCDDVSEHSVCSIFIGGWRWNRVLRNVGT